MERRYISSEELMVVREDDAQHGRWLDKDVRGAHVEFGGRRDTASGTERPWNDLPFKEAQPLAPSSPNYLTSRPMSVNQRGRIVGQVVRPGLAAPERKQKRLSTPHPHPPAPPPDIIEISSDEEEPQPPSKRALTKRGYPLPTHEPYYKARLSQKDREIEKLKKVRHQ